MGIVSCGLAKWGNSGSRYKAVHDDGTETWLNRVSNILDLVGGGALKVWAINECLDSIASEWLPGVPYEESEVAGILNRGKWAHSRKADEAKEIGTRAHKIFEDYALTGAWPDLEEWESLDPRVQNCADLFLAWWEELEPEVIDAETVVWLPELGAAGTVDLLCITTCPKTGRRVNTVIDHKTSKGIYMKNLLQQSAYREALKVSANWEAERVIIARVGKEDSAPQIYEVSTEDLDKGLEVFKHLSKCYDWLTSVDRRCYKETKEFRAANLPVPIYDESRKEIEDEL